jgi:hypothetical protein
MSTDYEKRAQEVARLSGISGAPEDCFVSMPTAGAGTLVYLQFGNDDRIDRTPRQMYLLTVKCGKCADTTTLKAPILWVDILTYGKEDAFTTAMHRAVEDAKCMECGASLLPIYAPKDVPFKNIDIPGYMWPDERRHKTNID